MTANFAPLWIEANQRYLAAELACLRANLEDGDADRLSLEAEVTEAKKALPAPAALDLVAEIFGLSRFERALLLLCAGVEMDARIAQACARATSRDGRGAPTFGLALGLLQEPHWSALTPSRPLRRFKLIEVEPGWPLASAPLKIDERILHLFAGVNAVDARLRPLLVARPPPELMAAAHETMVDSVCATWQASEIERPLVHLYGEDAPAQEDVAASLATRFGLTLLMVRAEDVPASAMELDVFHTLWEREAALLPAALLVRCEGAVPPTAAALAEIVGSPLFVASRDAHRWRRPALAYEVQKPDAAEQCELWRRALGSATQGLNGAVEGASAQFRLSARTIASIGAAVGCRVAAGEDPAEAFWTTCRTSGRRALEQLAGRDVAASSWNDLVLPEPQLAILRQIGVHVRHRVRVYDQWGFGRRGARGLGVTALFAGESGTGKTLAAEVLATELDLDLYRIDLSSVVSKYIGETEKNLRAVFDAAEDSGAILLFDEADALFGKRSDVKDSHDRYANIEVSYLLQRMEAYRGLAVLTTNLKNALDASFQRRLRFTVQFPFPDEAHREAIWRRAFPSATPTHELDFGKLARFHAAGGTIRNIAINAAFLAAEANEAVGMAHLFRAAHAESSKLDRPLGGNETRGWL